jgi:hypothetical protein
MVRLRALPVGVRRVGGARHLFLPEGQLLIWELASVSASIPVPAWPLGEAFT